MTSLWRGSRPAGTVPGDSYRGEHRWVFLMSGVILCVRGPHTAGDDDVQKVNREASNHTEGHKGRCRQVTNWLQSSLVFC